MDYIYTAWVGFDVVIILTQVLFIIHKSNQSAYIYSLLNL